MNDATKRAITRNINIYLDDNPGALASSALARLQRAFSRFDTMSESLDDFWSTLKYSRDGASFDVGEHVEPYLAEQGVTTDVRDALDLDPIPGWAIARLADYAGSQVALAEMLDVNPSTVRRWIAPDGSSQSRNCSGMSARVVRTEAGKIIKHGSCHGRLRVARERDNGTLEDAGYEAGFLHIDEARDRAVAMLKGRPDEWGAEFVANDGTVTRLDRLESVEVGDHEAF